MARAYSLANKHAKVARENAEAILRMLPDLERCRKGMVTSRGLIGLDLGNECMCVCACVCLSVCLFNGFF